MCYQLFETMTFMLFGFAFIHRLHHRSVSTFLGITTLFVFTMANRYTGDMSSVANSPLWLILCVGSTAAYARAMFKDSNDKVKVWHS